MRFSTTIHLSKKAVKKNLDFIKKMVGNNVRVVSVVKANAYGHGIEQYVPIAEACGIDYFSVFNFEEACKVRRIVKETTDILIMGWIDNVDLEEAIQKGIEFFVFHKDRLEAAKCAAKKVGIPAKIHIEIETGLNRTGFDEGEFKAVANYILENQDHFIVKGICSHLAGAESIANYVRVTKQIKTFKIVLEEMKQLGLHSEYQHIACSAAAACYPESRFNLVRVGIMQYGFWSNKETYLRYFHNKIQQHDPLKRVIRWTSNVMSVKQVETGEFISYGITYLAQEDKKIAIIPLGYSNGYARSLSNNGRVLIRGARCGVIGLVNMNMIIADVTYVEDVKVGDEVVLIGEQDELEISVSSFSEISQQMNYEILSRLPLNIPRKVIE